MLKLPKPAKAKKQPKYSNRKREQGRDEMKKKTTSKSSLYFRYNNIIQKAFYVS